MTFLALLTYLDEHTSWSYYEFLTLYRDVIISSPPFTDEWNGLDGTWTRRFLKKSGKFKTKRIWGFKGQGVSVYVLTQVMVDSERSDKGLQVYWEGVIHKRKKLEVKRTHIIGSLNLLNDAGKYNVEDLSSEGFSDSFFIDVSSTSKRPLNRTILTSSERTKKARNEESGQEEADEQISSADEKIEIKCDDLEELEQQITFSSLNEWEVGTVNVSRKFKEYQRQLIAGIRQKKTKLTWNNTLELLALSSIIVMCWPCPYSTFTSSEWRQVLNSNPYKITQPILTDSLLTAFYKATNDFSLGLNCRFTLDDNCELSDKARRIFDYIKGEIPLSSKQKETETKHNIYNLDPFIKIIFGGEYTPYTLEFNKSVNGKQRPDFSCVIDDIAILNSEIKPLGYTQYRKDQDFVKVHLKGKKSINQLLGKGGPNKSMAFLNMGDTIESFVIDLAYDGVYRSWPCFKNKLTTDKGSFPLIVLTFSHFVMIEQHVGEIINDYENRPPPGSYTPPEQIENVKFIRKMPTTPQLKLLLKQ
ncbi:7182_t:CDS:10 [Funneliformis geosporum]|uniref:7182_t:CDS:1 n=1 Tax=Funneliformis geosporum TaxID=1117311 RepID=A0A9W4T3Y6_9GLOM|nr:7182_t:CDS:10 [Funneliformis geosporum]